MSPKSIIIFILIGILIYIFINDEIELCYIEKFNNQANQLHRLDIDNISADELVNILKQEINTNLINLNNKNNLKFNHQDLRNLKKNIHILINKINNSSLPETEKPILLYKS